jgi:8-oxo-dGTP pyrophosphatase MutT (NUDIX family)
MSAQPSDSLARHFPVSIKGVVFRDDRAILLRNERDEWELPGGKLDAGESPAQCCAREILEELALVVSVDRLLDCWVYDILGRVKVLIVTYGCLLEAPGSIAISAEHKEVGFFRIGELDRLPMPEGYRASVRRWWSCLEDKGQGYWKA